MPTDETDSPKNANDASYDWREKWLRLSMRLIIGVYCYDTIISIIIEFYYIVIEDMTGERFNEFMMQVILGPKKSEKMQNDAHAR